MENGRREELRLEESRSRAEELSDGGGSAGFVSRLRVASKAVRYGELRDCASGSRREVVHADRKSVV